MNEKEHLFSKWWQTSKISHLPSNKGSGQRWIWIPWSKTESTWNGMINTSIPYNRLTAKRSEKSANGSSSIILDVGSPLEVEEARVAIYTAVSSEDFQFFTMLSPQREKRANVISVNFINDIMFDPNLCGARTSEKIMLTTTGNMVNDATLTRGKGVATISLGSMCSWKQRWDEMSCLYVNAQQFWRVLWEQHLSYHICFPSLQGIQHNDLLPSK